MKRILLILSLLFVNSCGLNEENRRYVRYNLENGNEITLMMFEKKAYFGEERTFMVYVNDHQLKDKYCEDQELKIFGNKLFSEVAKQNTLPTIESGNIYLAMQQIPPGRPLYCIYLYSKKDNGEWVEKN